MDNLSAQQPPTNGPLLAAEKKELRAATRARRLQLSLNERIANDQLIQARLIAYLRDVLPTTSATSASAPTVTAFIPTADEPGGVHLADVLRAAGFRVVLPRVNGKDLEWSPYDGVLSRSSWGLLEPVGEKIFQPLPKVVDMAIIPAMGVDSAGHRLGQGGGFYDRQLAIGNMYVTKLAIVDHWEFHEHVPHAPHDLTVNTVITEHGVFEI